MAKAKKAGKTSGKKASGGGKKAGDMLIVASKMKDAIRKSGFNVAGDAIHHLNERVHAMLSGATHRAGTNGRKTVRGHDF
jgi:histone H3/H4